MIATKSSFEPHSTEPLPNSGKVYAPGKIHPEVRVPFREIKLSATKSLNGRVELNEPLRVYDCSGPWGDADFKGDVEQGLPNLRRGWVRDRGDVEEGKPSYRPIPGRSDASIPASLQRKPLRAKPGKVVTQFHYARQGTITPEMEFIAVRENLGLHASRSPLHAPRSLGGESFGASIPDQITPEFVRDEVAAAAPLFPPISITQRASR